MRACILWILKSIFFLHLFILHYKRCSCENPGKVKRWITVTIQTASLEISLNLG